MGPGWVGWLQSSTLSARRRWPEQRCSLAGLINFLETSVSSRKGFTKDPGRHRVWVASRMESFGPWGWGVKTGEAVASRPTRATPPLRPPRETHSVFERTIVTADRHGTAAQAGGACRNRAGRGRRRSQCPIDSRRVGLCRIVRCPCFQHTASARGALTPRSFLGHGALARMATG